MLAWMCYISEAVMVIEVDCSAGYWLCITPRDSSLGVVSDRWMFMPQVQRRRLRASMSIEVVRTEPAYPKI